MWLCSTNGCMLACLCLQTTFHGRVFMTHATKAIYRWMLSDYIKVRFVRFVYICCV